MIAARCASRCGAVRDRATCSNSARSSSDKTSLDRLDLPAMPKAYQETIPLAYVLLKRYTSFRQCAGRRVRGKGDDHGGRPMRKEAFLNARALPSRSRDLTLSGKNVQG